MFELLIQKRAMTVEHINNTIHVYGSGLLDTLIKKNGYKMLKMLIDCGLELEMKGIQVCLFYSSLLLYPCTILALYFLVLLRFDSLLALHDNIHE